MLKDMNNMNKLNTISNLYKFADTTESLNLQILQELASASAKGFKYFVIGDISDKVTGFQRGSLMSNVITNLKHLKDETTITLAITNTYEDINFYKVILEKVPGVCFQFDKTSAEKYSTNSIEEWEEFTGMYDTI